MARSFACNVIPSSDPIGRLVKSLIRVSSSLSAIRKANALSASLPSTSAGSSIPNAPSSASRARRDRPLRRRNRLRLRESELLCKNGVEHSRRKESGQSPVLESLLNDCVACLRLCRAQCHVDGLAETLRGKALAYFGDDEFLEVLYRLPILGLLELAQIFFFALVVHRRVYEARFDHHEVDAK